MVMVLEDGLIIFQKSNSLWWYGLVHSCHNALVQEGEEEEEELDAEL